MPIRRQFLQTSAAVAALYLSRTPTARSEDSPTTTAMTKFMAEYDVPGISFACARNGEVLTR